MLKSIRFGLVPSLTVVLVALYLPASLPAMEFPQFDKMDIETQSEFVAVMIDATQKALRDDGKADLAAQMNHLFTTVEPGDSMPLGLVEYPLPLELRRLYGSGQALNSAA